MKKFIALIFALYFSVSAIAQIPFAYVKNDIDLDAKAWLDQQDSPQFFRVAWSNRVRAFKNRGTWTSVTQLLVAPYTKSKFNGFIDAKTLAATASPKTVVAADLVSPYYIPCVYVGNQGFNFYKGQIQTNFIPSVSMTLNNTCFGIGFPAKSEAISGSPLLATQSSTQILQINANDAFNKSVFDAYGSGTGGRISQTSTDGARGVYYSNRQSSTNFKAWKNGVNVASTTSAQPGILPTTQLVMNTSSRNEPIAFTCAYSTSLTDQQVIDESNDWNIFLDATHRNIEPTKVLLWDGDSHGAIFLGKVAREVEWSFMQIGRFDWKYWNVCVAGQTIEQMQADYSTEVTPLLAPAAYIKKILVIFGEPTNAIEAGTALATIKTDFQAYCASARANGALVVVCPLFARNYTTAQKCVDADSWNTWIAANWSTFADAFVNFPNSNYFIPRSGSASDAAYKTDLTTFCSNTTYFYDGIHLTENLGYVEWGTAIFNVIKNL